VLTGLPGLPGLTGFTGLPVLTGLPGLAGLPVLTGLPGLTGLPVLTGLPGLAGLPGLPGLPGLAGLPGLTGLPGPAVRARPRAQGHGPSSPHSFTSAPQHLHAVSRRGRGWHPTGTPRAPPVTSPSGGAARGTVPSAGSRTPRFHPAGCFSGSLLSRGFPGARAPHFPASPIAGTGPGGSLSLSLPSSSSSSSSAGSVQPLVAPALRKALLPKMGFFNLNQGVGGSRRNPLGRLFAKAKSQPREEGGKRGGGSTPIPGPTRRGTGEGVRSPPPGLVTHPCGGFLSSHPLLMVGESGAAVSSMLSPITPEKLPEKAGAGGRGLEPLSLQLLGTRTRGRGLRAGGSLRGGRHGVCPPRTPRRPLALPRGAGCSRAGSAVAVPSVGVPARPPAPGTADTRPLGKGGTGNPPRATAPNPATPRAPTARAHPHASRASVPSASAHTRGPHTRTRTRVCAGQASPYLVAGAS